MSATTAARVFSAMEEAGLDALVLHRRDSIAYATGTAKLWTAGTRPFSASCVLVAGSRSVHLLSTWDEGVPPEVPFENLYGVTWNPAIMQRSLGAIPGLAAARRIGVDGLSVGFAGMAGRLAPEAEIVPADDLLYELRAVKLAAELDRIRAATAVAAAAVAAATAALTDGASPTGALEAAIRAAAAHGVTIPSSAPIVALHDGLAHVDIGVLVDDYEGGQGRTVALPSASADEVAGLAAAGDVHQRLIAACRPGATAADLRNAAVGSDGWRVRGTGLGFEPPVVTTTLGADAVLQAGMVLSVESGIAGACQRTLVHVTPKTTDVL